MQEMTEPRVAETQAQAMGAGLSQTGLFNAFAIAYGREDVHGMAQVLDDIAETLTGLRFDTRYLLSIKTTLQANVLLNPLGSMTLSLPYRAGTLHIRREGGSCLVSITGSVERWGGGDQSDNGNK